VAICEVCGRPQYVSVTGCWRGSASIVRAESDDADCYRLGYARAQAEVERVKAERDAAFADLRSFSYVECENCAALFGEDARDEDCGPMHYAVQHAVAARRALAPKPAKAGEGE